VRKQVQGHDTLTRIDQDRETQRSKHQAAEQARLAEIRQRKEQWAALKGVYWLLGSSVQKQAPRDRERTPFPACKPRRVGVQSDVVNSMLMLEHRYFHVMEKLLLWLVL
jgi:hypothetical protein